MLALKALQRLHERQQKADADRRPAHGKVNPHAPKLHDPYGLNPYHVILSDSKETIAEFDNILLALGTAKSRARGGARCTLLMRALNDKRTAVVWIELAHCAPPGSFESNTHRGDDDDDAEEADDTAADDAEDEAENDATGDHALAACAIG